ncbi:GNAT family N-acetyltransferase [Streptomyces sp. bgisy100]|uniref:GNAT family N-acetyltransferase n=1 Tax=Streptomyces sp. bgisy100 TaxID=3413783 RepID=UPI003D746987
MTCALPVPVVLHGRTIRLEPLTAGHVPDLFEAGGADDEVWRWQSVRTPGTEEALRGLVEQQLAEQEAGLTVPFAVVLGETGRAVGQTTYLDLSAHHEQLEIGSTWYGRARWGTAVNPEAKLLLLTHAFEELGMGRVQWKTHHRNVRSQQAIARLGARHEGVLRRHRQQPDGSWRDSVYYSMLADEWPPAKARLVERVEGQTEGRAEERA